MNNHDFNIVNTDTDSISVCKKDKSAFTDEERKVLLQEINDLMPEKIKFGDDGYYDVFVVLKAKNYILYNSRAENPKKRLVLKGSSLKSSKMEPALKLLQKELIDAIIFDKQNYTEIYHKYILEALNVKDISRWASKKSISEKTMTSERANETKIMDALADKEFSEGDKVYLFFLPDESLACVEDFDGSYNVDKLLEKCYKTCEIFKNVLDTKSLFVNYKLKKNKKALEELCRE